MRSRALAVVLLLGLAATGCSLGPRQTWAVAIRNADEAAARIGSAKVHVHVEMKVIETIIRVVPSPLFIDADGVADFKHRRSKLTVHLPAARKGTSVVFDDLVSYFPRSPGARQASAGNMHWIRFDFTPKPKPKIDANDRLFALGSVITPTLADEVLRGVLAGSVRRVGTARKGGAATTEYFAKLAPDAAVRDLRDEQRRNGILRMFKTIGVQQDVFPVYVWLDDHGLVRGMRFVLKQEQDIVDRFRTTVDYEFSGYGVNPAIALPAAADTISAQRYADFVADYTREQT